MGFYLPIYHSESVFLVPHFFNLTVDVALVVLYVGCIFDLNCGHVQLRRLRHKHHQWIAWRKQCGEQPQKADIDKNQKSVKRPFFMVKQMILIQHFSMSSKQGFALKNWVEGLSDEAYYPWESLKEIRLEFVNPTFATKENKVLIHW